MMMKKTFVLFTLTSLSALILYFVFQNPAQAVAPKKNPLPSDYYTGMTWKEAQKNNKPTVINFYVDWCSACRKFAPVFEEYRKKYEKDYNFVIIKTDSPINEKIVRQYYIPGYPTVYLVNNKENKRMRVEFRKYFDPEAFKEELDNFIE